MKRQCRAAAAIIVLLAGVTGCAAGPEAKALLAREVFNGALTVAIQAVEAGRVDQPTAERILEVAIVGAAALDVVEFAALEGKAPPAHAWVTLLNAIAELKAVNRNQDGDSAEGRNTAWTRRRSRRY